MMGRSHLIIGTGVSLSVLQLLGMQVTAPAVTVALIGSLLPDIDEPNSLLVSKALPSSLIRLLQTILLPAAVFVCILRSGQTVESAACCFDWACLVPAFAITA